MALRERKARVGAIPEGGMADIAFLLLVFFLVTTTIDMDKGLGIILPAEGQELEINKKNILNCLISASGNVLVVRWMFFVFFVPLLSFYPFWSLLGAILGPFGEAKSA